jgi:hypothetical protein
MPRKAKVTDLDLSFVAVQDVGRLEVPVKDPVLVQIRDSQKYLLHDALHLHPRNILTLHGSSSSGYKVSGPTKKRKRKRGRKRGKGTKKNKEKEKEKERKNMRKEKARGEGECSGLYAREYAPERACCPHYMQQRQLSDWMGGGPSNRPQCWAQANVEEGTANCKTEQLVLWWYCNEATIFGPHKSRSCGCKHTQNLQKFAAEKGCLFRSHLTLLPLKSSLPNPP